MDKNGQKNGKNYEYPTKSEEKSEKRKSTGIHFNIPSGWKINERSRELIRRIYNEEQGQDRVDSEFFNQENRKEFEQIILDNRGYARWSYLLHSDISKERKKKLKNILVYFKEVDILDVYDINWKINYNKNNQNYRMLIYICNFIIKGLLQTTLNGKTRLLDFADDQKLSSLYEKFILEYYKKEHPEINANASYINWQFWFIPSSYEKWYNIIKRQ